MIDGRIDIDWKARMTSEESGRGSVIDQNAAGYHSPALEQFPVGYGDSEFPFGIILSG